MPAAVSVCIPSCRAGLLDACLASLAAQEHAPSFELLVSADGGPELNDVIRRHFPDAAVVDGAGLLPGEARNALVEAATGDVLLFLDDDVSTPPRLLHDLAQIAAEQHEAAVFGGPNLTPPGSSFFQVVQGEVLASAIGSGPVHHRYRSEPARMADERRLTLCNLAVRRRDMHMFDAGLACAEENGLLSEIEQHGRTMVSDPRLAVFHQRRPTLRTFVRQLVRYGRGRGQLTVRNPHTCRIAYLIPPAFIVYLALLPLFAPAQPPLALVLVPYAAMVAIAAIQIAFKVRRPAAGPLALFLLPVAHLSYGVGVFGGLSSVFSPRRHAAVDERETAKAAV